MRFTLRRGSSNRTCHVVGIGMEAGRQGKRPTKERRLSANVTPEPAVGLKEFIHTLRGRGVRLWSESGRLRYKGPKGAVTEKDAEILSRFKPSIQALLQQSSVAANRSNGLPKWRPEVIPLSFTQLAHWNLYGLDRRPSLRNVVSAVTLRGRLDLHALRDSMKHLVQRHEALRTSVVMCEGTPVQVVAETWGADIDYQSFMDISPQARAVDLRTAINTILTDPVWVTENDLSVMALFSLAPCEHVLIIAFEHLIADAFSMTIVLDELFSAYRQLAVGAEPSLPKVQLQFSDYSVWQRATYATRVERLSADWSRLTRYPRVRYPQEVRQVATLNSTWGSVTVDIDMTLKGELWGWCRINKTTPAMAMFSVYASLLIRWYNTFELVILYQSDGRGREQLDRAIGYYASMLYIDLRCGEGDGFDDILKNATRGYCTAYEHADQAYLEAQFPRPDFTRNPSFNWQPYSEANFRSVSVAPELDLTVAPFSLDVFRDISLERDTEPQAVFSVVDNGIRVAVYFSQRQYSFETMQRFAENIPVFLRSMLETSNRPVANVEMV
jgi:hypothetical protein